MKHHLNRRFILTISAVVLLCGGDKSTQARDIEKAKEFWNDYNRE